MPPKTTRLSGKHWWQNRREASQVPFSTGFNTPATDWYFMRNSISFYNLSADQSIFGLYIIY